MNREERQWIMERIKDMRYMLWSYDDTWFEGQEHGRSRPCICWPDGSTIGMGWASHMSGDPGGFKRLGFKGYSDFYFIKKKKRNKFLRDGRKLFVRFFKPFYSKKARNFIGKGEELEKAHELFGIELVSLAKKCKRGN